MKVFEGLVVSVKMNNTAVVEITRRTPHPLYRKLIKVSKKYKVDSSGHELVVGQSVKFVETRPISKGKFFKIMNSKKPAVKTPVEKKPVSKVSEAKTTKTAKPRVSKAKASRKGAK